MKSDVPDTTISLKTRPSRLSAPLAGVFAPPHRNYTIRRSQEYRALALKRALAKRVEKRTKTVAAIEKRRRARQASFAKRAQLAQNEASKDEDGDVNESMLQEAEVEETPTPSASEQVISDLTAFSVDENSRPKRKCVPSFEYLKTNRTYTRKVINSEKMREVRIKAAEKRKQRLAAKRDRAAFMRSKTNRALKAAALAAQKAQSDLLTIARHSHKCSRLQFVPEDR